MYKALTYSSLTFVILAIGMVLTLACSSSTEAIEQTPPQQAVDTSTQPSSTTESSSATESAETPPAAPASSMDLGHFALIPESERQLPSDFQLITTTDEPFSVADRPGEIIVLYQTEF